MAKSTTGSRSRNSSTSFNTLGAATRLMDAMAIAIDNMIEEVKKPVDQEITGSARKAELQSVKQTAVDCKELLRERQSLEQMVKELKENGTGGDICRAPAGALQISHASNWGFRVAAPRDPFEQKDEHHR